MSRHRQDHLLRDAGAVLALALAVHGMMVLELATWPGLAISMIDGSDMEQFLVFSVRLLEGTWPGPQAFHQAPLYHYLLAGMLLPADSVLGVIWQQAALQAVAVTLVFLTATRVRGRAAGWAAAAIMLSYAGGLFYCAITHSTSLEMVLAASFLLAIVHWQEAAKGSDPARPALL
jgi:hypothetical protein